jgi:hypothetical protein
VSGKCLSYGRSNIDAEGETAAVLRNEKELENQSFFGDVYREYVPVSLQTP